MSDSHSNDCVCPYCERGERIAKLEAEHKRLLHIEVVAGSTLHRIAKCCTERTAKALAQTAMSKLWPGWDKGATGELRTVFQPGEKYETLTVDEVVERDGAELVQRIRAEERDACAKVAHDVAQSYECDPEGSEPESSAYARVALDVETRICARGAK